MAGFLPDDKKEQIRAANDIVDVIGAVVPLKRAGANFVGLCPFHKEKSPSFNVSPQRQTFHCFGCQKGGDVYRFVQEYENLSFMEAVKRLADRVNIPVELERSPGQQQARQLKETLLQMHEQIAQRWQNALANEACGQVARDYLARRGVSAEAIRLFRLGYAPEAWDDTVNWAKNKGYELPVVEQGGLILRKEGTDRYYDRFRGRLMFPICDEQSRVVGFSGRILSGDEKTAKYVNSPETAIFTKGRVFFGLDKSKRAILDAGKAIICEGQLDLIACYMAGVGNIVAPQGTAFTAEHARILKRYADEVVLCFDSDSAGQNAAVRALDGLLGAGLAIRVVTVPAPHDPDSFIKEQGGAAFQQLVGKAEGFFDFYLNRLCATNDITTDRGRLGVVKNLAEALRKTNSPVLLDTYAQKAALRLAVAPEAMRAELRNWVGNSSTASGISSTASGLGPSDDAVPEASANPLATTPPSDRELWLLRFLLCDDEHVGWAVAHLDLEWIQHPVVRRVVDGRFQAHTSGNWQGVPRLLDVLDEPAATVLITQTVAAGQPKGDLLKNLVEAVRRLRADFFDRQIAACRVRLSQPDLARDVAVEILRQQSEWRRLKQEPLASPE
jgi:DNA primase